MTPDMPATYAPMKGLQGCRKNDPFRTPAWRGDECAHVGVTAITFSPSDSTASPKMFTLVYSLSTKHLPQLRIGSNPMTNRTGTLAKSPLKYVVASIRFAPWPMMAKKMDEIQNELREVLPVMHHIRLESAEGQAQAMGLAQEAWMLAAADKNYCVQISKDQVIFFTAAYTNYKDFCEKNSRALKVLYKFMNFIDVTNAGTRYIDHVKPRDNEKKSDYICKKFLAPAVKDFSSSGGQIVSEYIFEDYKLRVNVLGIPGAFPIPPEMISIPVILNGPEKPFQVESLGAEEFIVDMDAVAIYTTPKRLTYQDLESILEQLHSVAHKFFRHTDVFTDHAFNVWKGES